MPITLVCRMGPIDEYPSTLATKRELNWRRHNQLLAHITEMCTTRTLRLPPATFDGFASRSPFDPLLRCSLCVPAAGFVQKGNGLPVARTLVLPVLLLFRLLLARSRVALPSSQGTLVHLPCSQTPARPPRQAFRRLGSAPTGVMMETPAITLLSGFYHTAFALAVYASCRHH
jgi:hypothetical protein